jgi:D-serine deaminase-like pyridoxal phosphate-dependent protein
VRPFPRAELPTPALVVDRPALGRNIARMARFAATNGLALRPHAKTHKSADIARLQLAAGAVGVCCAKLGEAEALAEQGIGDVLLTSPVVAPWAVRRLIALASRTSALSVVADHPDGVAALAVAAREAGCALTVLIDVDPGMQRTGVASPEAAVELARIVATAPALRLGGVQFYCGREQHIASMAERRAAIVARTEYLRRVLEALAAAGHPITRVTGSGTGTFMLDAALGLLTELQCGSYVFMDREYLDCELDDGAAPSFEPALTVEATVISANHPSHVTVDAGFKALAADAGPPSVVGNGAYRFMGDEHGAIVGSAAALRLGDRVALVQGHCDPTVNLYDRYAVVEDDNVIDNWPVTARGRAT